LLKHVDNDEIWALSRISPRIRVRVSVSIVVALATGGYSWIWPKSETNYVVLDVLGQEHLYAIIEQVEEMLRTTCHTVIKSAHEIHTYKPTS